jgi:hypothetical protein
MRHEHPPIPYQGDWAGYCSLLITREEVAMIGKRKAGSVLWIFGIASLLFSACWNPFALDTKEIDGDPFVHKPLTSPENVFYELNYAMNQKEIEPYEDVLDDDYLFISESQTDTLDCRFPKTEDVRIVGIIFDYFDIVRYELMETGAQWTEYGSNIPPEGAMDISDEHPDENWEVFRRPVTMDLLDETKTDGWYIDSNFEFKMRKLKDTKTGEQIWKIVRWEEYTGG